MSLKTFSRTLSCTAAALASLPVTINTSLAQDAVTDGQEVTVLERLVITGRKQTELEEKAPVSATVLQPEDVPPSSLDTGSDIARKAPNTNFIDYNRFGDSFVNIRGVSTLGSPLNTFDSTVGFSVDGVPTSTSGFAPPLLDIERIEVLRGPQGTTFGRNALGGVINVVGRPADGERELRFDTEVGTNGHVFVQGTAGGWISPDILAGRGVVRLQKYDGDIPNPYLGENLGGARIGAARGTIRYTPDATWTIDVTGNFSRDERTNPSYLLYSHPNYPTSGEDIRPQNERTIAQGVLSVRKNFDDFSLTSTTSYQYIDIWNLGDFTDSYLYGAAYGIPPAFLFNPSMDKVATREDEGIFSQELRLNSAEGSDWQWVAGASYLRSDYSMHRTADTPFPSFNGEWNNAITSETYAAFGDVTVPVAERWSVSGGMRLAHDRQSFVSNYDSNGIVLPPPNPPLMPTFSQGGQVSDTYVTGRASLAYDWSDDVMTYASVARGYASGGFEKTAAYAGLGIASPPFNPATSWTYEIGTKANLANGVTLRGAVFYNDVRDGQLSGFDQNTFQVFMTNQDFRSYGAEIAGSVELLDGLDLLAGVGYTKTRMVNVTAQSAMAGAAEGNQVPQVPEWSANLGLDYRVPGDGLGLAGEFTANVNYQFVGSRFSDLANNEKLVPYHIVNLRVGWENENVGVYGFVNNLLDERPLSYALTLAPGVRGVYVGRGRVVGLGASMKW